MLGQIVYFWLSEPPDPQNIDLQRWLAFLDELAGITIVIVAIVVGVTLFFYRQSAIRKRIRTAADPFSSYTPIYWLLLTVCSGVVLLGVYAIRYGKLFESASTSWVGNGVKVGIWVSFWTFLIASVAVFFIPGITPVKWRYRPLYILRKGSNSRSV